MASMLLRFAFGLWVSLGLACACDCVQLPSRQAERAAEIVFQGTVVALRDSGTGYPIAVFKVSRVWKGHVSETFEMPARKEVFGCIGFIPTVEVGAEFLVYAYRLVPSDHEYLPQPCQTDLVRRAAKQLQDLGDGQKPKSK